MGLPVWFSLSIGAALVWSIGYILTKKGLENVTPLWNSIIANTLTLIIWVPVAFYLSGGNFTIPTVKTTLALFGAGLGYMSFFYVISKAELSLSGTLLATYPLVAVTLSHIFLNERITSLQYLGIVIILLGGVALAWPDKKILSKARSVNWVWWGIAGSILSGTSDFLTKVVTNNIGSYSNLLFFSLAFQILSVVFYLIDRKGRKLPVFTAKNFVPTLIGVPFILSGSVLFLLAFGYGKASLVAPTTSIYPAFMVLFAVLFLKDKLNMLQAFGIVAIVAGAILIGVGTA